MGYIWHHLQFALNRIQGIAFKYLPTTTLDNISQEET